MQPLWGRRRELEIRLRLHSLLVTNLTIIMVEKETLLWSHSGVYLYTHIYIRRELRNSFSVSTDQSSRVCTRYNNQGAAHAGWFNLHGNSSSSSSSSSFSLPRDDQDDEDSDWGGIVDELIESKTIFRGQLFFPRGSCMPWLWWTAYCVLRE